MRIPLFEPKAAKRTVSVTLNSDLYEKAKSMEINVSKVAEEALAQEYAKTRAEAIAIELREGLQAAESYADQHGAFADIVREHYGRDDGSV
jgi:antitoxin CcdA